MSYSSGNLVVDFDTDIIHASSSVTCQSLVDILRAAEASEEGICFDKIIDAEGKGALGGSSSTGILVTLQGAWVIKFSADLGQVTVSGGNIASGLTKFDFTSGTQIVLEQPLGATLVETGVSGLTAEESAALDVVLAKVVDIFRADFNRRKHDKTANTITLYGDDGVTPFKVFDADDELTEITPQ